MKTTFGILLRHARYMKRIGRPSEWRKAYLRDWMEKVESDIELGGGIE